MWSGWVEWLQLNALNANKEIAAKQKVFGIEGVAAEKCTFHASHSHSMRRAMSCSWVRRQTSILILFSGHKYVGFIRYGKVESNKTTIKRQSRKKPGIYASTAKL